MRSHCKLRAAIILSSVRAERARNKLATESAYSGGCAEHILWFREEPSGSNDEKHSCKFVCTNRL